MTCSNRPSGQSERKDAVLTRRIPSRLEFVIYVRIEIRNISNSRTRGTNLSIDVPKRKEKRVGLCEYRDESHGVSVCPSNVSSALSRVKGSLKVVVVLLLLLLLTAA